MYLCMKGALALALADDLKTPIVVTSNTDLDVVKAQLKSDGPSYVFLDVDGEYVPVKSFALLLHLQDRRGDYSLWEAFADSSPLPVLPFEQLTARALDVLSQEVTLVRREGELKYILREDFFLNTVLTSNGDELSWLRNLFSSIPRGLMIVDLNFRLVNSNAEAHRILRMSPEDLADSRLNEVLGKQYFEYVMRTQNNLLNQVIYSSNQATMLIDFVPLVNNQVMTGYALVLADLPSAEAMAMELDSVKELNEDLNAILSTIYDEIVVVDGFGQVLRASENYVASQWDQPPQTLIGETLPKFKPQTSIINRVIREVQKHKRKVSMMDSSADAQVLTVGNPVFANSGKLQKIILTSRDLTEFSRLQRELESTRKQRETYKRELEELRQRVTQVNGLMPIYSSPVMHAVMQKAERVAPFSATVLLQGESGVGKEVIASAIHSLSERRDAPMIKINCSAIPESLLESELFGYEKGAFSGANPHGKAGLFVKADKGTLFLDEISEIPVPIQAKLLRAIQEREVYPVGSTEPVRFDTRIVAATNQSLPDLVAQGKFREDLFYRVNVFPIDIPPLRERTEDIGILANHFLYQFNKAYQRDLRLTSSALELLEAYDYPGNVRELQNLVQRIAISANEDVIDASVVEQILMKGPGAADGQSPRRFSQVVPLKQALEQVEDELVSLAMEKYHSSTKAAKALGINQSTVSRKYQAIQRRRMHQTEAK